MVPIAVRVHPFPFRTRKLSSPAPKVLGWKRPGRIGGANTGYSSLAQLVEHAAVNRRVVGSSPTRGAKEGSLCRNAGVSFFCSVCWFLAYGPVFRQTHPAVNWLRRCRRLRREKAVPELEETGSGAPATRATRDHVSDRRGRWFEPNTGSQLRVSLNNLDGRQSASLSRSGRALNVY